MKRRSRKKLPSCPRPPEPDCGFASIKTAIAEGLNVVKVSVADVRVEGEVKLMDFTKWLEKAERPLHDCSIFLTIPCASGQYSESPRAIVRSLSS